jgi:hypothetical protein
MVALSQGQLLDHDCRENLHTHTQRLSQTLIASYNKYNNNISTYSEIHLHLLPSSVTATTIIISVTETTDSDSRQARRWHDGAWPMVHRWLGWLCPRSLMLLPEFHDHQEFPRRMLLLPEFHDPLEFL